MKHFKRIISVFMTVCLLLSAAVTASAASAGNDATAVEEQVISFSTTEVQRR